MCLFQLVKQPLLNIDVPGTVIGPGDTGMP